MTSSRGLAALVAILALALALPGLALAHGALVATGPVSGETAAVAPDRVALTFGAGVDPTSAAVRVPAAAAGRLDVGPVRADSDRDLSVALRPDLPDGTYTVTWRAVPRGTGTSASASSPARRFTRRACGCPCGPHDGSAGPPAGTGELEPLPCRS